jgi:RecJ-like exonuclease
MRGGAAQFDGIGGGHEAAAGAKITKDKLDGFLDYLESNVTKMPDRNSNQ